MVSRQAMLENANQVYALAAAEMPPDPKVLDEMLGKLLWWSNVDFTIGAVNSILVGGKLRLIENEEIRFFLASLPERLATTKQTEANDYSTLMNFSVPYMMKHADLAQIVMTMTVRPGGLDQRVNETYGGTFERLVALKTRYDPTNLFRLNANVRPRA